MLLPGQFAHIRVSPGGVEHAALWAKGSQLINDTRICPRGVEQWVHGIGSCWAERAPVGAKQVCAEVTAACLVGDGSSWNLAVLCRACRCLQLQVFLCLKEDCCGQLLCRSRVWQLQWCRFVRHFCQRAAAPWVPWLPQRSTSFHRAPGTCARVIPSPPSSEAEA